ncbi:uncharacterized protein BO95DRAFT_123930 [Aspergillus brunneoviolaceus CBS 621.78]|uniref:Uncharacterized protein n=1 Tax=Aspergillus brunneoviolaceus CBS 621.78 TaxID=1450534 RepID=A0ACD1GA41_9EURO|nr:hypothetical protein BO95DRAFT_123930 [Aspergillus brunneoviolaceus CBS 621.78]RAH46100.1 hypothetical protein BO95DRAFT_123930 [Aspergillus brunneoviolaceus CBS 621.78]
MEKGPIMHTIGISPARSSPNGTEPTLRYASQTPCGDSLASQKTNPDDRSSYPKALLGKTARKEKQMKHPSIFMISFLVFLSFLGSLKNSKSSPSTR